LEVSRNSDPNPGEGGMIMYAYEFKFYVQKDGHLSGTTHEKAKQIVVRNFFIIFQPHHFLI
jgi:hypothetical protein